MPFEEVKVEEELPEQLDLNVKPKQKIKEQIKTTTNKEWRAARWKRGEQWRGLSKGSDGTRRVRGAVRGGYDDNDVAPLKYVI